MALVRIQKLARWWSKLLCCGLNRQFEVMAEIDLTWHTLFIMWRLALLFDLGHFHAKYEATSLADPARFSDNDASPHFDDLLDDSEA